MIRKMFPMATFDVDPQKRILSAEFTANVKIDLAIARELVQNRLEITNGQAYYMIIEFSNVREITTEAKEYFLRQDGGLQDILAAAFLANNPVSALIANILIKSSMKFPARYFSKKSDAEQWIHGLDQALLKKL